MNLRNILFNMFKVYNITLQAFKRRSFLIFIIIVNLRQTQHYKKEIIYYFFICNNAQKVKFSVRERSTVT